MRKWGKCAILICAWIAISGAAFGQGWQHIGNAERVEKLPDGVELSSGHARVRVTVFRDGIVRVRLAPQGNFPKDFSWAVIESPEAPSLKIEESKQDVRIVTSRVVVLIQKSPILISFLDPSGSAVLADEPALPMAWDGPRIHAWKRMPADEGYYGLGDKAGPMNRRNRSFTMWNTDAFGWQESTDPLYKTFPFWIGLRTGTAYGVFFDNTYWSSFDFGKESNDYYSFGAEGGELNYYFFAGPEPKTVLGEYTAMIGRTPLPPLWSLGYHQSRYSYYPEIQAIKIAQSLREKQIPADAIYLDIDYQNGNRPFTIDRQGFPSFEQMIKNLRTEGFHTVLITDLHVKKEAGYAPYDSGMKADVFVKDPDGTPFVGAVWPGDSVFPDFTLTRARDWWGGLYKEFVDMGAAGFWNDMNEPSVFFRTDRTMPRDAVHRLDDGTTLDHRAIHNVFGLENARATYEGVRKLRPDERPFVLTRAGYPGSQRYAASWTGDNSSTWNHLKMSVPMLMSLGISGYPLMGDDIGGYAGSPPADLLTRWFEVGALNPIYRDHTAKGTADQEPWVNGPEHESIRKRYIELRYRLLPYIYTAVEEMSRTGMPLMRPIFLEYPEADNLYDQDDEYLFGRDLLVSPVLTEMVDAHEVHLPPGDWYDYWDGSKHGAAEKIKSHLELDQMPIYVRSGAILPEEPLVQNTTETPNGPLELRVYPGADCGGSLYLDDGHTFAYQKDGFVRMSYACRVSGNSVTVSSAAWTGSYQPWWTSIKLEVFGIGHAPTEVRVGSQVVKGWKFDGEDHSVVFAVPDSREGWTVSVTY
ncbi:MAG TPA: glycoside hydrolase family 31 protein [Candidatus Acidoferrales bacterium]